MPVFNGEDATQKGIPYEVGVPVEDMRSGGGRGVTKD